MREGNGVGAWDLTRLLITAAILFTMAMLVVGTGLAQLSERIGVEPAGADPSAVVVPPVAGTELETDIAPDVATDIGSAAVEHAGPLRAAGSDHLTIVRIAATTCGERRTGSGVVVADGLVLTAAHVVGDAGIVRVDAGGVIVAGEVLGVSMDGRDLALVAVDAPMDLPLTLGRVDRLGEPVTIVGFPGGGTRVETVGPRVEIAGDVAALLKGEVIAVESPAAIGVSGGPALDGEGGLVGIVVATETVSGTALVVGVDDLDVLTAEHMIAGECPTAA